MAVIEHIAKLGAEMTDWRRADMDALPIVEANTFAHRSTHAGRMHACGPGR